jgi:glyoxylase-like metal-dependent hydrolase (beta-lactamase superfamily II)/rhodanese-related sulfurtransferase
VLLCRQFVNEDLGCACYLVGDPDAGVAVVVDPPLLIEPVVEAATESGLRIERVLETHTHADHVSGHGRLALEHSLPVAVHPLGEPAFPFESLADGQVVEVGSVRITVLHTPGHRPEHCAFLVDDQLVLTGDSLFVGDAARPDLAVAAREGAQDLFHSLARLTSLPAAVEVLPGHVAGSLCGGNMSSERRSTIGHERENNAALEYHDVQEFVLVSASVSTPRPPTTERVVALNRGPWLALPDAPAELDDARGATVLDVRPFAAYTAGHVPGSISVPVSGDAFGTKAGFVLTAGEDVVLHASNREEALEAAQKLWAVGVLELAGYVVRPQATETLATVDTSELKELLDRAEVQVVDVREASERDSGYLPGSTNIPYRLLRKIAGGALERNRPVVTVCESGPRAAIAASLLQREGFDVRAVAGGGVSDFAGDIVSFRRCGG